MAYTKQLLYEVIRSIDSATFTGSYQAVGTALVHPVSIVTIINNCGNDVTISVDGTNDYDFVRKASDRMYQATANTPTNGDDAVFIPQGTQFYVKAAASTGLVYIVVQYIVQV